MSGRTLSELAGNGSGATALPTHILLQAASPCYWEHQHPSKQLRLKDNHTSDLRQKSLSLLSYIKIPLQFLWVKHAPGLSSHYERLKAVHSLALQGISLREVRFGGRKYLSNKFSVQTPLFSKTILRRGRWCVIPIVTVVHQTAKSYSSITERLKDSELL